LAEELLELDVDSLLDEDDDESEDDDVEEPLSDEDDDEPPLSPASLVSRARFFVP
jgi:hypothetical protein